MGIVRFALKFPYTFYVLAAFIVAQNLTLPSGLAKIGDTQYTVRTNAMAVSIADLNEIPVKYTNGPAVFLKDVGQVHDGWAVQQNVVHRRENRPPEVNERE